MLQTCRGGRGGHMPAGPPAHHGARPLPRSAEGLSPFRPPGTVPPQLLSFYLEPVSYPKPWEVCLYTTLQNVFFFLIKERNIKKKKKNYITR